MHDPMIGTFHAVLKGGKERRNGRNKGSNRQCRNGTLSARINEFTIGTT